MSKIYIREVDLTTVESAATEGTDVVYIPGFSSLANSTVAAGVGMPTLCKTIAEFETYFGTEPAIFAEDQDYPAAFSEDAIPTVGASSSKMFYAGDPDPSYIYAKELLVRGLPIVYERVNKYANEADAGAEPYDVTVANMYAFLSSHFTSNLDITAETSLDSTDVSVDNAVFNEKFPAAGTYVLVATATATATTTIVDGTVTVNYDKYIKYLPITTQKVFTASVSNVTATGSTSMTGVTVTVDPATFSTSYSQAGIYTFTYVTDGAKWIDEDENTVNLANIGITLSTAAAPTNGATISVVLAYTTTWKDASNNVVNLNEIGLIITAGVPTAGNTITVTLSTINATGNEVSETASWPDATGTLRKLSWFGITLTGTGLDDVQPTQTITVNQIFEEPIIVDKSLYSIKYITTGGYPVFEYSGKTITQAMANLAAERGDCIALIDHTDNPFRPLVGLHSVYSRAASSAYALSASTSSYAAMFTPYCSYTLSNSFISVPDNTFNLPPSFAYLSCLANSISLNPSWLAIAGATRGKVPSLVSVDTDKIITNSIADSYTPDNATCVNPITNIKPYGQCIWGNRTLVDNSLKAGTTALSFLNIRNLVCDIKKQLFLACQSLLFEQNTDVLWVNFLSLVTPLLDQMVSGYGLSNYKIIREAPSDKSVITATIRIYPVYAVESFDLTIYLQNGEVEVQE